MNYIAGVLLYHAEEYMAFWILVIIFENIGVRDNYLPGMDVIIYKIRNARSIPTCEGDGLIVAIEAKRTISAFVRQTANHLVCDSLDFVSLREYH
jgi:hypothetical protein